MNKVLKSYFYWTYPRGSFHYDVMVTLILLFIFVTPASLELRRQGLERRWPLASDPGRERWQSWSARHRRRFQTSSVPTDASENEVRKMMRKAIEPVTGDAVSVVRWETALDPQGNRVWKIWARR